MYNRLVSELQLVQTLLIPSRHPNHQTGEEPSLIQI